MRFYLHYLLFLRYTPGASILGMPLSCYTSSAIVMSVGEVRGREITSLLWKMIPMVKIFWK